MVSPTGSGNEGVVRVKRRSYRTFVLVRAAGATIATVAFALLFDFSLWLTVVFFLGFPVGGTIAGLLSWRYQQDFWRRQGYEW